MAVSPLSKQASFKLGRSRKARTGTPRAAGAPNRAHSNTPKHTSDTQSSNWHIHSLSTMASSWFTPRSGRRIAKERSQGSGNIPLPILFLRHLYLQINGLI
ncbi:unnamed protein product [Withania somnifera]